MKHLALSVALLACVCSATFAKASSPVLISLSPSTAVAGGPGFTLTVNGQNFTQWSSVLWNGSVRNTTFVSSNELQAGIPASDIASPGTATISVRNLHSLLPPSNHLTFTITSNGPPPLTILTTTLPEGTVQTGYAATLVAQGGTPPYTWGLVSGALPPGLFLSGAGVIAGTPTAVGTSYFTVQVRDSGNPQKSDTQPLSITISDGLAPPPPAPGYHLAFHDEFDTLSLSPNGYGNYSWYNPGMYWESAAPYSNIYDNNSILNLDWDRGQSPSDTSIATAAKDGSYYRAWRYGYFEARMRWDTVVGAWPAFWMIPEQGINCNGCETGELDIFEGQGAYPTTFWGNIHDWSNGSNRSQGRGVNLGSVDLSQFHTYGALWTPGQVSWYFDNQYLFSEPTYPVFDQQNYYLILGSQEGVNWQYGNLNGVTASTIKVNVDWVRVWQP